MALVRTNVSEESVISIIRVKRISEIEITLAVQEHKHYKSHTASHSKGLHSSESLP
jgi:hypothetical protein